MPTPRGGQALCSLHMGSFRPTDLKYCLLLVASPALEKQHFALYSRSRNNSRAMQVELPDCLVV